MKYTALLAIGILVASTCVARACSIFYYSDGKSAIAGNNEDFSNPNTKVRYLKRTGKLYGCVLFEFDNAWPQGGMNDQGLFFDGAALPSKKCDFGSRKRADGAVMLKVMRECATVQDAVALLQEYYCEDQMNAQYLIGDRLGNSVIVDGVTLVKREGNTQVATNFRTRDHKVSPCGRFNIANTQLKKIRQPTLEPFRKTLAAVHQEGENPTLYSCIYDLRRKTVHLYHFHNYENPVVINLPRELMKDDRLVDLPSLFPRTYAAETFARTRKR